MLPLDNDLSNGPSALWQTRQDGVFTRKREKEKVKLGLEQPQLLWDPHQVSAEAVLRIDYIRPGKLHAWQWCA